MSCAAIRKPDGTIEYVQFSAVREPEPPPEPPGQVPPQPRNITDQVTRPEGQP